MRDKPTRAQLTLGVIGLGPSWEENYRDAVRRLSSKLSVRAICDSVHARAVAAAEEFGAAACSSPWLLATRRDIKAWLILDPGSFGIYPAELAVRVKQPTLFANCFSSDSPRLPQLFSHAIEQGETLLTELPQRFLPSTTRLRELIATKLGPVSRIRIEIACQDRSKLEIGNWLSEAPAESTALFDWCACLISQPIDLIAVESRPNDNACRLQFITKSNDAIAHTSTAEIVLIESPRQSHPDHVRSVECERGSANITSVTGINWQSQTEHANESLVHERSPFEIVLDQFCRRALGGLVPVPPLTEALRALAMRRAAIESLTAKVPVSVKLPLFG